MKICLITLTFPPDSQGGEGKFFKGIFEYLKKEGYDVTLLTGKWTSELDDPRIKQINIIPRRFFWVPQFTMGVIKYLNSHQFDIIHGNGPKGTFPILFSKYKRYISTIHDLGPFETPFTKIPIEKHLIRLIAKRARYITTCSNIIRKELAYYVPEIGLNNIFNLYSAIEQNFKPCAKKANQLKHRLNLEGPVLLFIGRIAHYKGVEDIIKAYLLMKKSVPDLNLVIGGKPDFAMEEKVRYWKNHYKDILFVGFVDEEELPIYYSMADIFVTYSHASEGFGLTPIEAIACGTPVVCSAMPAYKEVLKDHAIFVKPKSPQLLANALLDLLKNDSRRADLINKAMKFINKYTWDAVGKKLERVYNKFLNT